MTDHIFYISEYFRSIQGEGNFSGVNSLFLRFQFCNLPCSWCDTKYTWHKLSGVHTLFSAEKIQNLILQSEAGHIILTGGEPTLYRLDLLETPNKKFHVESNGTIIPTQPLNITLIDGMAFEREAMSEKIIQNFNWVISPKLKNAGQSGSLKNLEYWVDKTWSIFKFVAANQTDLDEIDDIAKQYSISKNKIFIALQGITPESQIKPDLVDEIVKRGYHFSPRLHVMLWGSKRKK